MKAFSFLAVLSLGTALLASPASAQDSSAVKFAPQVKALLDDLLKQANTDPADKATRAPQATLAVPQKLPPELLSQVQTLLNQILKAANADSGEDIAPATNAAPSTPASTPAAAQKSPSPLTATGLTIGTVTPGHLMPSGSLGGHGLTGGTPRLSDTDWRQLFPLKQK